MIFLVFCLNVHILSPFEVSSLAKILNLFMMLLMQEARKRFDKANVTYDQVGITPQLLGYYTTTAQDMDSKILILTLRLL